MTSGITLPAIFITSFLVGLSGAMMPGPLLTITIAESSRRGFMAGPLAVSGHAFAELVLTVALAAGLGNFLSRAPVMGAVGLSGGAVLLLMGYGIVKAALNPATSLMLASGTPPGKSRLGPAVAGVAASISNPYWLLWWATLGASYLAFSRRLGFAGLTSFFVGHIASDFVWFSVVSLVVVTGSRAISDRVYRWVLALLGLFLMGLAVFFAVSGVKFLMAGTKAA